MHSHTHTPLLCPRVLRASTSTHTYTHTPHLSSINPIFSFSFSLSTDSIPSKTHRIISLPETIFLYHYQPSGLIYIVLTWLIYRLHGPVWKAQSCQRSASGAFSLILGPPIAVPTHQRVLLLFCSGWISLFIASCPFFGSMTSPSPPPSTTTTTTPFTTSTAISFTLPTTLVTPYFLGKLPSYHKTCIPG